MNLNNEEFAGLMKVGVFPKNQMSQKIYGPVVNYSTTKQAIKIKFFMDYEQKTLKVYSHNNLKGEVFSDLPDASLFPSAQNMTMRNKNVTLKLAFTFDLAPFEFHAETGCIKDL
jgi:hypothetical protein